MESKLKRFEALARALGKLTPPAAAIEEMAIAAAVEHPFDRRNIHPKLPPKVKKLFDDGHFAEATYHAFKFLDKKVEKHSALSDSGFSLMMDAFNSKKPKIQLTPLKTTSEIDEQEGYRFIFAGGVQAIRNPRAHEFAVVDDPDTCLDHLAFVSLLMRRLEQAGFV
jgi:uncharacterized protein (TIGR02391 family)